MRPVLILALSYGLLGTTIGCGLDWTLPHAHFNGVEEDGYVSYWEKMGEANLGSGIVIPININFNSNRKLNSPYLGKGWMVALLESHVEPIDENSMRVIMPDGWTFTFLRNLDTDTWRGNAGWMGQTNGSVFTISAPCGWRVKFDKGKIQEIDTSDGRALTYRYNSGMVTEVDEEDKPFVQIETTNTNGIPSNITIEGRKLNIAFVDKPRISKVLNQVVITGMDQAVGTISEDGQNPESFSYNAGQNLISNLTVVNSDGHKRIFQWDPVTNLITKDDDWTYTVVNQDSAVSIERKNSANQTEEFDTDNSLGYTLQKRLDGSITKTWQFVNAGKLNGSIRKIETYRSGKLVDTARYSYNPKGDLIRFSNTEESYIITTAPDQSTRQATADNGTMLWTEYMDSQQRVIRKVFSGGKIENISYHDDGSIEEIFTTKADKTVILLAKNQVVSYKSFDPEGKLVVDLFSEVKANLLSAKENK